METDPGTIMNLVGLQAIAFALAVTFSLTVLHHGMTVERSFIMPITHHAAGPFHPGSIWSGTAVPVWRTMGALLSWVVWAFAVGLLIWCTS